MAAPERLPYQVDINQQLPLELPKTRKDLWRIKINQILGNVKRRESELQLITYWKTPFPALAIVSSVFLTVGALLGAITYFNQIQARIPLYFNAFSGYFEQVDKFVLLVLPFIFFVSQTIILRLNYEVHKFDIRLSNIINLLLTVLNFLFMLAISQLYSLVLPG